MSLVDEGLPGDLTKSTGFEIGEIPEASSYDRSYNLDYGTLVLKPVD